MALEGLDWKMTGFFQTEEKLTLLPEWVVPFDIVESSGGSCWSPITVMFGGFQEIPQLSYHGAVHKPLGTTVRLILYTERNTGL